MKLNREIRQDGRPVQKGAWVALATVMANFCLGPQAGGANRLALWDTGSPLPETIDVESRTGWRSVPSELLSLEIDPAKASSDPGYYGREYAFQGDAVVQAGRLAAAFASAKGRVVFYTQESSASPDGAAARPEGLGRQFAQVVPLQTKAQPTRITQCTVLRNAGDEVALRVSFARNGGPDAAAVFLFDKTGIAQISPAEEMKGISLQAPLEYAIAPGFIGEDLIFNAADYPSENTLSVPARNLLLGLLQGGASELVLTWPKGNQGVKLALGAPTSGERLIASIDFDNAGQSLYLAALAAPGLWHRERLTPAYLEKDVAVPWKRPFPAKWVTQLQEGEAKTTYAFRDSPGHIWRGVAGQYPYPVWFSGETAFYHLSKKVLPKGESLIYFLEGKNTPFGVATPVEILKATVGRQMSDAILDLPGRQLRTHHRRGGVGVRRACTCGCTEAIQVFFEAGLETQKQDDIAGQVQDMIYFVRRHVERIDEYRRFADDLLNFLQAQRRTAPELQAFLDPLEQLAQRIPQEFDIQKENMKSLDYAAGLERQTLALAAKKDANNLKAYMELLKAWRGMGGAQDYVVAQCHVITRKLCQAAGYGCATFPKAVALAEEIQARCRRCLRNPDGYEIWADY